MALYNLLLPKMGESVAEATIIKWNKSVGDRIEMDDTVVEIATDKVDSEVPSPVAGKLVHQLFDQNDVVQVGAIIAVIETAEAGASAPQNKPEGPVQEEYVPVQASVGQNAEAESPATPVSQPQPEEPAAAIETVTDADPAETQYIPPFVEQTTSRPAPAAPAATGNNGFYSPLVKNIAVQEKVTPQELETIRGTGADGRLTKDDLLAYVKERNSRPPIPKPEPKPMPRPQPVPQPGRQQILSGGQPLQQQPVHPQGQQPMQQRPVHQVPGQPQGQPIQQRPVQQQPVQQRPVQQAPVQSQGQQPVQQRPVQQAQGQPQPGQQPIQQRPVQQAPVQSQGQQPLQQRPVQQPPVHQPAQQMPPQQYYQQPNVQQQRYVPQPPPVQQPAQPQPKAVSLNPGDEIIEMDRMRRLIAEHMVMSVHTSPHVTSFIEADVTNMVVWRDKVKGQFETRENTKMTFTPLFIECVARAIKDMPMINVSVNGTQIIKRKDINVGMATALPSGNLIVPVIRRADQLNLVGLTKAVNDLSNRARINKLTPDEIKDGTFTVTNVGSFGNVMGTPIINQPQVAILALGAIKKKPAVIQTSEGDVIAIRHMMFLSLSYDHRVVDGALGGSFLRRVADYMEAWDMNRGF